MHTSRRRALTWALVALGIAIVALGGVLAATFPWSETGAPFAHFWGQRQGVQTGGTARIWSLVRLSARMGLLPWPAVFRRRALHPGARVPRGQPGGPALAVPPVPRHGRASRCRGNPPALVRRGTGHRGRVQEPIERPEEVRTIWETHLRWRGCSWRVSSR